MKIILDFEEVKALVLARINADFVTSFDEVSFDGYSQFKTATVCVAAKPKPKPKPEPQAPQVEAPIRVVEASTE